MQRLCTTAIFLLLNCCFLCAQESTFIHYTVDDGLPSSHVYYVMQDSQDYMWFGTDKGLCRFDGYEYKTYTVGDGLPFNDVWRMVEDSKGRIWLATFGPNFHYIQNDSIVRIENPNRNLTGLPIHSFTEDQRGNIWIHSERGILYRYKDDSLSKAPFKQSLNQKTIDEHHFKDYLVIGESVYILHNDSCYHYRPVHFLKRLNEIALKKDSTHITRYYYIHSNEFHNPDTSINFYNNNLYFSLPDSLIKIEFPINHCTGYPVSLKGTEDYIFKCDTSIFAVDKNFKITHKYDFINKFETNHLFSDRQNNLWIPTDDDGVFMRPSNSIYTKNYKGPKDKFAVKSLLKTPDGILWIGTEAGQIYRLEENKKLVLLTDFLEEKEETLASVIDMNYSAKENKLCFLHKETSFRCLFLDDPKQHTEFVYDVVSSYSKPHSRKIRTKYIGLDKGVCCLKAFGQQDSDTLWIQSCSGLIGWSKNKDTYQLRWHKTGRGYALAEKDEKIWLGRPQGLFYFENLQLDSLKGLKEKYPILNKSINQLALDSQDKLWIGTDGYGVFCLKDEVLDTIPALKNTIVKKIFIDEKDEAWVTSNQGLYHIQDKQNVRLYTTAEGLSSNEVNSVYVDSSSIYVGTNKGLTIIDRKQNAQNNTPPPLHLTRLLVRGEEQTLTPNKKEYNFDLDYDQNSLKIEYVCLSFESNQSIIYEYKLSGIDTEWKQTKELSKEYPILPHGQSYTLELRAKDINQTYSNDVYKLNFKIGSPWWETGWFRLSVLTLIVGFVIYRINRFKQKEREKTLINKRFAELELNALQSQMNPHFIFNALQAIQDFVAGKDERAANKYMSNFSKLMRLFLESSKEKYISLEEELKLLSLYMELEQLRFEPPFTFEIDCPESIDWGAVEIPSMLLQPFVENAINHGLKYKKGQGFVKIKIREQNNRLIVRIIDDGIGIKKAKEIKERATKSYKSRSMTIIEERIKTIQFVDQVEIKISVQDRLIDDQVKGTIVEIVCPFFEKY